MRDDSATAFAEKMQERDPQLRALARQARSQRLQSSLGISDIVQETVTQMTRHRHRFAELPDPALRSISKRFVFRVVVDFVRKSKVGRLFSPGSRIAIGKFEPTNSSTSISERASRQELQQIALALIHRLPEHYRRVVQLRYLDGEAFETIANEMNRSVDAVQKLHVRAVEQLRRELETVDGFRNV